MTKRKTKKRERETFDISEPPYWLTDKMDWQNTPEVVRAFIVRRTNEQERGLAMCKDRRFGRPKRDPDGFYALQLAKEKLAYLERRLPADHPDLMDALREAARWQADLDRWYAAMEGFEAIAKARGLTLAQLIEFYQHIEQRLYANPIEGMRHLWSVLGDGRPFEDFARDLIIYAHEQQSKRPEAQHVQ